MSLPVLLALGVGGAAVVASSGGAQAAAVPQASASKLPAALTRTMRPAVPIGASKTSSLALTSAAARARAKAQLANLPWPLAGIVGQGTGPGATSANPGAIAARAATDKLKAEALAAYNAASADAKCAMVDAVNKKYSLKLDCKSTPFEAIVTAVTGAAGAAAGTALCGPPCSVVGGIVGTWAGKKLGPFAQAKWQKLEDWAGDLYGDAADWASDKASDTYDYVAGLF